MMPVDGLSSAPTQCSAGSSARASAALSRCRSGTPLACAVASSLSSAGNSSAVAATISLPQRWWATRWLAQKSYSSCLPRTHNRARRLPVG